MGTAFSMDFNLDNDMQYQRFGLPYILEFATDSCGTWHISSLCGAITQVVRLILCLTEKRLKNIQC